MADSFVTGIRLLVHSNVFISIAATSAAISTIVLAGLSLEVLPLFIVFAVTLFVYSFNRLADRAEDRRNLPDRADFISQYGTLLFGVGTLLYVLATTVAVLHSVPGSPALVIPLVVAVLYSVVGIKQVLLVKNALVGIAWGLIPLGVGVYYGVLWTLDILFMAAFLTVMITIAAMIFDIKDIEGDRAEGIRSVPLVAGPRLTRIFAAIATSCIAIAVAGLVIVGVLDTSYVLLLAYTAYVFGYSLVATEDRTVLFYGFVIDGEHVFLAVLVLACELI